ncbi:hypothetical protein GCM10010160_00720 [Acrocarpospora corrugata]
MVVALVAAVALGVGGLTVPAAADPIVKPQRGTFEPHKVRWTSAKPYKKGKYLKVTWWSGPQECWALDHVKVKETGKKVTVTLYEGSVHENGPCIMIAIKKTTLVKLKSPLGKRKVVDGAKS